MSVKQTSSQVGNENQNTDKYIIATKEEMIDKLDFPFGSVNQALSSCFTGKSYIAVVNEGPPKVSNVIFEPGCRNNWHIHHADEGGGQLLICLAGVGWYQEWGKPAQRLVPGKIVNIPAGVKHWHGAAKNSWFSHLAMGIPGLNCRYEWCEKVDDEDYLAL